MRDIRNDLLERLKQMQAQRSILEAQVAELIEREAHLNALLQAEEESVKAGESMGSLITASTRSNGSYSTPLGQFVLGAFQKQSRCSLRQLKEAAKHSGIDFGDKSPGRVIHFLLLGMEQNGIVERLRDGTWQLKERVWKE